MKKLLSRINRKENVIEVVQTLASICKIEITNQRIQRDLEDHPNYPSLLSISDTLTSYGVENVSLKIPVEKLEDLPLPLLVPIQLPSNDIISEQKFTIVDKIYEDLISYLNPETGRWDNATKKSFLDLWKTGFVMVVDADEAISEDNYKDLKRKYNVRSSLAGIVFLVVPLLMVALAIAELWKEPNIDLFLKVMYYISSIFGLIFSSAIVWTYIDEYNPVVRQICGSGKKANCGAVLNSNGSKIFGIDWGVVGLAYFTGSCLLITSDPLYTGESFLILFPLSLLGSFYIIYSIYYQWRILNQWCILCLVIQFILFFQFLISLTVGGDFFKIPPLRIITTALIFFTLSTILIFLLVQALKKSKKGSNDSRELKKLRYSKEIFDALLQQQKTISHYPDKLGILIGNPLASIRLIKVCNPYCIYCSLVHGQLKELVQLNQDIQVQMIFTASAHQEDPASAPVRLFMDIQRELGENAAHSALDDWYSAQEKNFDDFAKKYPVNGNLTLSDRELTEMSHWCSEMAIEVTPTFFIDKYQLPEIYKVADLKYFLSV